MRSFRLSSRIETLFAPDDQALYYQTPIAEHLLYCPVLARSGQPTDAAAAADLIASPRIVVHRIGLIVAEYFTDRFRQVALSAVPRQREELLGRENFDVQRRTATTRTG